MTLIFGVYPITWALKYMFYDYQGFGTPIFIGLDNFERILRDDQFWSSVVNTFVYAGGKLIVTPPVSLILAVILNQAIKGRQLLRAVYFLPTIISASVMSVVFYVIFNSYNGVVNQLLGFVRINAHQMGVGGDDSWGAPASGVFAAVEPRVSPRVRIRGSFLIFFP